MSAFFLPTAAESFIGTCSVKATSEFNWHFQSPKYNKTVISYDLVIASIILAIVC